MYSHILKSWLQNIAYKKSIKLMYKSNILINNRMSKNVIHNSDRSF